MRFEKSKKGVFGWGLLGAIFMVIGMISAVFYIAGVMGDKGSGLSFNPADDSGSGSGDISDNRLGDITYTEDVTTTFSSFDMFSRGTSAGTAHRILELDGTTSSVVADDSTLQKSPGNSFLVLLGNETDASTITAGTDYYPRLVKGVLPDSGTFTIGTAKGTMADKIMADRH